MRNEGGKGKLKMFFPFETKKDLTKEVFGNLGRSKQKQLQGILEIPNP